MTLLCGPRCAVSFLGLVSNKPVYFQSFLVVIAERMSCNHNKSPKGRSSPHMVVDKLRPTYNIFTSIYDIVLFPHSWDSSTHELGIDLGASLSSKTPSNPFQELLLFVPTTLGLGLATPPVKGRTFPSTMERRLFHDIGPLSPQPSGVPNGTGMIGRERGCSTC